jgi:predicted nucleotidyltransferase
MPDVDELLESLHSRIRAVLGERLAGLYLYGSLTTGDFDPGVSDVDLLAATASNLTPAELDALRAMHDAFERDNPAWRDRIEVAYLSLAALKTFRTRRSPIAVLSPGEPFNLKDAGADWLMNWYAVRQDGIALFGPPPDQLIDPISDDEFAACVRGYVAEWAARIHTARDPRLQAHALLTACRALHLHRTGERASKRRAAAWAEDQLPQWAALIRASLALRSAPPGAPPPHPAFHVQAIRFVDFTNAEVAAGP